MMERFYFNNNDGAEYEVIFRKPNKNHFGEDCDGICACPEEKSPKIHISPHLTKQSELNTSVHEFAHAFFWEKSEREISHFANTLSRFLYNFRNWRYLESVKAKKSRGKRGKRKGKKCPIKLKISLGQKDPKCCQSTPQNTENPHFYGGFLLAYNLLLSKL